MQLAIAILGSSVLTAIVTGVFNLIKDKHSENRNIIDGLQYLMYDRIKHNATKSIAEGKISLSDYEDLKRMHEVYHNQLHGNGFLNSIMAQVDKLPKK